jgi:hypothetical protein
MRAAGAAGMTIYPMHIRRAVVDIAKIVEREPPLRCFDKMAERLVELLAEARSIETTRAAPRASPDAMHKNA